MVSYQTDVHSAGRSRELANPLTFDCPPRARCTRSELFGRASRTEPRTIEPPDERAMLRPCSVRFEPSHHAPNHRAKALNRTRRPVNRGFSPRVPAAAGGLRRCSYDFHRVLWPFGCCIRDQELSHSFPIQSGLPLTSAGTSQQVGGAVHGRVGAAVLARAARHERALRRGQGGRLRRRAAVHGPGPHLARARRPLRLAHLPHRGACVCMRDVEEVHTTVV